MHTLQEVFQRFLAIEWMLVNNTFAVIDTCVFWGYCIHWKDMKRLVYLDNRKQDLRCWGAQSHECEVGHSLIPDSHCCYYCFTVGFGDGHLFLLQRHTFVKRSKMLSPLNLNIKLQLLQFQSISMSQYDNIQNCVKTYHNMILCSLDIVHLTAAV